MVDDADENSLARGHLKADASGAAQIDAGNDKSSVVELRVTNAGADIIIGLGQGRIIRILLGMAAENGAHNRGAVLGYRTFETISITAVEQ